MNNAKSATRRDSQSVDNYIIFIFLFVFTLICQRGDITFKRKTKRTRIFKIQFMNGIAYLQTLTITNYENLGGKWDNLGFKNDQWENFIRKI